MTEQREFLKTALAELAAKEIYIGTSSWKYEGWVGQIYDRERYLTRGKWSQAKFERECLSEYAEVFPTVCVDAGFYRFPTAAYISGLAGQVPDGFKFSFKVTDTITLKHFPNQPRHGQFAGLANEHFLSAAMFTDTFLGPMEPHRGKIGMLIFEFTQFQKRDFEHGREFVDMLDRFFAAIPKGWVYGVELRNKGWLQPDYFNCLRAHGVAHVFNNWSRMPSVAEQIKIEDAFTAGNVGARMLLTPPRTYEAAVEKFQPYREIQEINEEARGAVINVIDGCLVQTRHGWVYVNNRLEGNAPSTIEAILRGLRAL